MSDEALSWSMRLDDQFSGPADKMSKALGALESAMKGDASQRLERSLKAAGGAADTARTKMDALARSQSKLGSSKVGGGKQPGVKAADKAAFSMKLHDPVKLSGFSRLVQGVGDKFGPRAAGAVIRLGGSVARLAPAAKLAGKAFSGLASAAGPVLSGAGMAGGLALGAGAVATGLTVAGGKWALESLTFKEDTLAGFKTMLGTQQAAERVFDKAMDFAAKTPFGSEEVVNNYKSLLTAGFKEDQLDRLMLGTGDVGASMGTEKMDQATRAIGQIKAKGRLQSEELMQLSEGGIGQGGVFEALAKMKGKSTPEVQKMISAGKITAEEGIEAVLQTIEKTLSGGKLGSGMDAKSKTLSGLYSSMIDIPLSLLLKADTAGATKPLKDMIGGIVSAFEKDKPLYNKGIAMFERVGKAWGKAFGAINSAGTEKMLGGLIDGIGGFGEAMAPLAEGFLPEAMKGFSEISDLITNDPEKLRKQGKDLAIVLGEAAAGALILKDAIMWLPDAGRWIGDQFKDETEGEKWIAEKQKMQQENLTPGEIKARTLEFEKDSADRTIVKETPLLNSSENDYEYARPDSMARTTITKRGGGVGAQDFFGWGGPNTAGGPGAAGRPVSRTTVNAPANVNIYAAPGEGGTEAGTQAASAFLGNLQNGLNQAALESGG